MRRLIVVMCAAMQAGCGGGGDGGTNYGTNPPNNNPPMNNPPATGNNVSVMDNSFDPATITVAVGATVTWTWSGYSAHNVTFNTGGVTSGDRTSGSYARTFNAAGTYPYHCSIHGAAMSGTITVQ